jgi:hypothetical protein
MRGLAAGSFAATTLCVLAMAVAGCSNILGFKDPTFDGLAGPGSDGSGEEPLDASDAPPDAPPDAMVDAPVDMMIPACVPSECPFGCDPATNACRNGKLWIFKTGGQFLGNGFGGAEALNVRVGADGKCLATYTATYGARGCRDDRVHAVLHVSASDSIALMATTYAIPTNAPLHRADDDALVADSWPDLIDPSKQLRVPATTAATDAEAAVWTGSNGTATCTSWTAAASSVTGNRGLSNRIDASRLSQDNFQCNRLSGLLCICWSGGE